MTDNMTILIVDDEEMQRGLVRDILRHSGRSFHLLEAGNGLEALEVIQRQPVDLVLMDKRMPVMDGDEACKRIRTELKKDLLPVIIVTGTNDSKELQRSFEHGATDFITKPYRPVELVTRVAGALRYKSLTDQLDSAETLLFTLARMVEAKDETTGDHCGRLAHMGVVFGNRLGLSVEQIDALRIGGVVHDIGKLGIPDSILLKQGPLNEQEWELMRQHTVIGGRLCEALSSMRRVVPIVVHHHERWDGSGYPYGLAGQDIPLLARVFQFLDIYDALASDRPYKAAFPREEIIRIFEQEIRSGWRDPEIGAVFLDILRNEADSLVQTACANHSPDVAIFTEIEATGVIAWGRRSA